ncbi:MAG TPA: hypothetical protein DEB31_04705, partial [Clostridiales bacterium]|nr:hypothetical protein [Clostridiales bacterium]
MKKVLILLLLIPLLTLPRGALAAANSTVTAYNIDIVVQEDNSYDITEQITQEYSAPSHGMYRTLPLRQEAFWQGESGETVQRNQILRVSDVRVSEQFEQSREDGNLVLKIGDPDAYVTGARDYTISYRLSVGDDGAGRYDQFYYNIVGPEWETPISGLSFRIQMPKEFDAEKVGFSTGGVGASGFDDTMLAVDVAGTEITGRYNGTLYPGQALTMRVELPQGYFTVQDRNLPFVLVCVFMLAAALVLFLLFRRKKKPIRTIEFYPPEGMTPADIGFIVDGVTDDRDVLALLIYWADMGYIEIDAPEKYEVTFIKKQELPAEANEYEQLMWNQLFTKGEICRADQLTVAFYETLQMTKTRIKTKFEEEKNRVFLKKSQMLQDLVSMLAAFPVAAMAGITLYINGFSTVSTIIIAAVIFFAGYGAVSLFVGFVRGLQSERRQKQVERLIAFLLITAGMDALVILFCYETLGAYSFIAPVCALIMALMTPFFTKRTERGLYWQGRILGLREFILRVELDKLNMLVEENPQYFYHILPYAYVLGLTDRWAKQFEALALQPPSWYYGDGWSTFSSVYFTSLLMRNMMFVRANAATRPNMSSGGGRFGGGFGGGGGGFS